MAEPYDTYKNDYQYFENVQDATLTSDDPAVSPVTGVKSLRSPVPMRMFAQLGGGAEVAVEDQLAIFSVWDVSMSGLKPRAGFTLTDENGDVWVVRKAQPMTFGTRWKLICVAER